MTKGSVKLNQRRYQLWRIWDQEKPFILYILLNPSYADGYQDDRTVVKLINFTKKFGFGGFYLGNLQTFITPYPRLLKDNTLAKEPTNLKHLKKMKEKCEKVVFGWGNAYDLPQWLKRMVDQPYCFDLNQNGTPKHPLYISYKKKLVPYTYCVESNDSNRKQ